MKRIKKERAARITERGIKKHNKSLNNAAKPKGSRDKLLSVFMELGEARRREEIEEDNRAMYLEDTAAFDRALREAEEAEAEALTD